MALIQRDRHPVERTAVLGLPGCPPAGWRRQPDPVPAMAAVIGAGPSACPEPPPMEWAWFPGGAPYPPVADAQVVRAARAFAVATLQRWGLLERREDVALVVSELLTNALRHALRPPAGVREGRPIRLGLLRAGQSVLCVVADPSPEVPIPREPGDGGETGRGLQVVAALSDQWGCTAPDDQGKIMWALLSGGHSPP